MDHLNQNNPENNFDQNRMPDGRNLVEGDPSPWSLLIPSKKYFITPLIVIINVLIYILMVVSGIDAMNPTAEEVFNWGGNFRPVTIEGEWWRLLTSCFLHFGFIHLAMNMYALVSVGFLLEPLMGKKNYLIAYLLTGIAASVTSLWWHDNSVSAGASGAVFGVYGLFLAMLTTNLINKEERQSQLSNTLIFVGYNLVYGLQGTVDNAAHIGGLLSGFIFGYGYYYIIVKENRSLDLKLNSLMIAIVLVYTVAIGYSLQNDISIYFKKTDEISKLETKALEVYKLPKDSPSDFYISKLQVSISNYEKAKKITEEIEQLDLPEYHQQRNALMKSYCDYRIKLFEAYYKAVKENSDKYDEEINTYNQKVEEKLQQIEKLDK